VKHSVNEEKLADFVRKLAESKESLILIHHSRVFGDNYQVLVESLDQLLDAGKSLIIVPTKDRG
jgi:hypothetical protein